MNSLITLHAVVALLAFISAPFALMAASNLRKLHESMNAKNPHRMELQTEVADNQYGKHQATFWTIIAVASASALWTLIFIMAVLAGF